MSRLPYRIISIALIAALAACGAFAVLGAYAEEPPAEPEPEPDPLPVTLGDPFPADGEATQIVDVWTRAGSKGKIVGRLYKGDRVTVLDMSGGSARIKWNDDEGYANANRLSVEYASDILAHAKEKGALYTKPIKGVKGDKIKDSAFRPGDVFYVSIREGKWVYVCTSKGDTGWTQASKLTMSY